MEKYNRLTLTVGVLLVSVVGLGFARRDDDSDGQRLKATVVSANGSGISGSAILNIGEDGVSGKLKAENLKPSHGYTVWFFYHEGGAVGGPGRFDSTVAEDDDFTFHGRVSGLHVSSGATIRLVMFDHPNLGPNNVTRANNLLTPEGGSMTAQAVFTMP